MSKPAGGFIRCISCNTMHGPTPACPKCGWVLQCSWCKRVFVPGRGWVKSDAAGVSHGVCPECAIEHWVGLPLGGETPVELVRLAAARLRIRPWQVSVRMRKHMGRRSLVLEGPDGKVALRRLCK